MNKSGLCLLLSLNSMLVLGNIVSQASAIPFSISTNNAASVTKRTVDTANQNEICLTIVQNMTDLLNEIQQTKLQTGSVKVDALTLVKSNHQWQNSINLHYLFNSRGLVTEWSSAQWDGAGWKETQKIDVQYTMFDSISHAVYRVHSQDDNSDVIVYKADIGYDNRDLPVSCALSLYNEACSFDDTVACALSFIDDTLLVRIKVAQPVSNEPMCNIVFTYSDTISDFEYSRLLDEKIWQTYNVQDQSYGNIRRILYEYNSLKHPLRERSFEWKNNGWSETMRKNFLYTSKLSGYVYTITKEKPDVSGFTGHERIVIYYDECEIPDSTIIMNYQGTQWVNAGKFIAVGHEGLFPDSSFEYIWSSGTWQESRKTIFTRTTGIRELPMNRHGMGNQVFSICGNRHSACLALDRPASVAVHCYDTHGRRVATMASSRHVGAGNMTMSWNPSSLKVSHGIYYYVLTADNMVIASRAMLF